MKKIFQVLLIASSISIVACEAKEETKKTEDKATEIEADTIPQNSLVESKFNYENDWKTIQNAIIEGNAEELDNWINHEYLNSAEIIKGCSEPYILEALKSTNYENLETEDIEGNMNLVFKAEQGAVDAEGTYYGTSCQIYMEQGESALVIKYVSF